MCTVIVIIIIVHLCLILLFSLLNCISKQINKIEWKEKKVSFQSFVILGLEVTNDALNGKSTWDALFQPPNFFTKYKYFIFI